jgi:enoyl-CoA hydratase/carnithine racemase
VIIDNGLKFETLLARMEGGTLVLTFNRPKVRNAISWTMEREFFLALEAAERLDEVTAVVLNANGEMFSAGHDRMTSARRVRRSMVRCGRGRPRCCHHGISASR